MQLDHRRSRCAPRAAPNGRRPCAHAPCRLRSWRAACASPPRKAAPRAAIVGHGSSPAGAPWRLPRAAATRPCGRHARAGCRVSRVPMRLAMGDDARQRRLAGVGIKSEAAMGDAAVALDMGRLDHEQARRRNSPACRDGSCASRCATPSSALYWHIGATTMRLDSSRSASRIGENKALVMGDSHVWVICRRQRRDARRGLFGSAGWPMPAAVAALWITALPQGRSGVKEPAPPTAI